jgi:hypothetical protein
MTYIKPLYDGANTALLQTRDTRTYIQLPNPLYLEPKQVYRIDLGLWMPYLPANTLVKLIDIHPGFVLLNHFWTASSDSLRLLILTNSTTIVEPYTNLCRVTYLPTNSLHPGNPLFCREYKKNSIN